MTRILAIETSTVWCSVALSFNGRAPLIRHEKVSSGASQFLLPWVDELLSESSIQLHSLDAIAIGVGPGAFTGVRFGIAVVQGLAIAAKLPVLPVASLDALAAQLILKPSFTASGASCFVLALDARMGEVYWAKYHVLPSQLPERIGVIHLSPPEQVDLNKVEYLAGSAILEFGDRLFASQAAHLPSSHLDSQIGVDALGVLAWAETQWEAGLQQDIHLLEPLYIRNKVALTSEERLLGHD